MTGLDEILSEPPTQEPPPPAQPEPRPPAEPPLPGQSDYPKTGDQPPPAPPAEDQEPPTVPVSALKDERKKRQELERRLAAFEQQQRQPPPPPRPDPYQDPEAALDYVQQRFDQQLTRTRLDMSVAMAKTQHTDYDEAEAAFVNAVHANPQLYQAMLADPHPAGFAYRVGRQVLALADIGGDPDSYRQKVRQEIEAEYAGRAPQPAPAPSRPSIPPSLAAGRDTQGRFAPAWGGPPSLTEILSPGRQ